MISLLIIITITYYLSVIVFETVIGSRTSKALLINIIPLGLWVAIGIELYECWDYYKRKNLKS